MKTTVHRPDIVLLIITALLVMFGILMVYDSSVIKAYLEYGDKFYFLKNHLIGVGLGLLGGVVVYRIDYYILRKIALPLLIFGIILILLVYIPGMGIEALGAQRWLNLGFFSLQPSELIKPIYVIYIATLLAGKREEIKSFGYGFLPFIVITFVISGLIILQSDFGTSIQIIANGFFLFFLANGSVLQIILSFPLLGLLGFGFIWTSEYRRARLLTFFNPENDPYGRAYHINQILIALGSGGWFGLGLGASRQKYLYLPEVMTDSIFAVVGEELGFVGVTLVLIAFFILITRGLAIVREAPDQFSRILAAGIIGWIAIQAIINLGSMASLFPLTGVPLPFISYGRSSNVTLLIGIGILLNISRHTLREEKKTQERRR